MSEVLVLGVVLDEEVSHAHQSGDGGERRRIGGGLLDGVIERVEHVGGGHGAHDLLLMDEERSVKECWLWCIDGVAPSE